MFAVVTGLFDASLITANTAALHVVAGATRSRSEKNGEPVDAHKVDVQTRAAGWLFVPLTPSTWIATRPVVASL